MQTSIREQRIALQHNLIGPHIPRLWCPPLTHYMANGSIDTERITAHWSYMNPAVGGYLVPGSTGDGWEMDDDEIDESLALAISLAQQYDSRILVGVLRTQTPSMLSTIERVKGYLLARAQTDVIFDAMKSLKVCGFTVCPPAGDALQQSELKDGLQAILDTGLPIAVYQLPQITGNEMSADLVTDLAKRYANFILFKDSSGEDRVAQSRTVADSVFMVRGAEGHYAASLSELGGAYNGLLLSTANCFPNQLRRIINNLEAGNSAEATALSDVLTEIITKVFTLVADIPAGNAFTNANKAIEHWMAWGAAGTVQPEPVLHAGQRLPRGILNATRDTLIKNGQMPQKGYLG